MADEQGFQLKPIHPIATLLGHLRLIFLCGVAGTLVLGMGVMLKVKPNYMSEAVIEIGESQSRILVFQEEQRFASRVAYTDYVNTQLSYILNNETLALAVEKVEKPNAQLAPAGGDLKKSIALVRGMLAVSPVRDSHLVTIQVESKVPDGLEDIANALVEAYLELNREREIGQNLNRIDFLRKELDLRKRELQETYELLARYTRNLGTYNFAEEANPHDINIAFLREALNGAYITRLDAENEYEAITFASAKERELGIEPLVTQHVRSDTTLSGFRENVRELEEQVRSGTTTFTEDHPEYRRIVERLKLARERLAEAEAASREEAIAIYGGRMTIDQQVELAQAEAALMSSRNSEREIEGRIASEKQLLIDTTTDFLRAAKTKVELANLEERIQVVESRIDDLSLESNAPSRVRLNSRAGPPGGPQGDKRIILLIAVAGLSFCGGLMLAFALDFLKPNIIDPRHIGQIIGSGVTGVLAHVDKIDDMGQLLRNAPHRYHADEFRRFFPKIFTPKSDADKREIITVISLSHGCGVTSLVLNCMTHLEHMGRRGSMVEVSSSGEELIQRTEGWNLREADADISQELRSFYPLSLRVSPEGCEFFHFETPHLKEAVSNEIMLGKLLDELKQRNSLVLIDAPPLLKDSEAELLCKMSDVVVLVISPNNNPGELKKGMSILRGLGVQKCAVIANNLPLFPGGYISRAIVEYEGGSVKFHLVKEIVDALIDAVNIGGDIKKLFSKKQKGPVNFREEAQGGPKSKN
ncbi:exopolysaccharide transport family protein [Acanthopleuribacter pedis]|uniref:Uncharacterized protein n=1 Tax=Acanthopleuribacter pedis TaxID=442870 RepID=A0A8J7U636_9BACT|nr:hypothetical protein [Acanthopleuribacter pedis]MBO1321479.1 hypothetical protein [Acanthopleuribacter pedis]